MENTEPKKTDKHLPWPMLILSGLGGLLIAVLVTVFVLLVADHHNGRISIAITSILFIIGAIATTQKDNDIIAMLFGLPLYITGFVLGFVAIKSESIAMIVEFIVAIIAFALCKSQTCRKCLLFYILWLPLQIGWSFTNFHHDSLFSSVWSYIIVLIYIAIFGGTINKKRIEHLEVDNYLPAVRFTTALVIGVALCYMSFFQGVTQFAFFYAIAFIFASASFAIAYHLLSKHISGAKLAISCLLALLSCAATTVYPAMAPAFLGMMLSFMILDYKCLTIFAAAFVASISKFYYDLDILLIHKSYLLMGVGALFLLIFFCIKLLTKNEQN